MHFGVADSRRKRARAMTTLVTGAAGFLGSHVARQLVARGETVRVLVRASSSNRAIADLPLEYVTGDLRDQSSLERAMQGVQQVFHVAADYRLWAKNPQDIYDSNVGGTKNLLAAAKHAGDRTADLHQHGRDHRGRSPGAAQRIHRFQARRNDRALQALQVDGGARSLARRERWFSCGCRDAHNAGRSVGLEADAYGKNHCGFSEWQNARLRGNRFEFCGCGRLRGRSFAGGRKRAKLASATC